MNDDSMEIDTENLRCIVLSKEHLYQLLFLFDDADDYYFREQYAENASANHRK